MSQSQPRAQPQPQPQRQRRPRPRREDRRRAQLYRRVVTSLHAGFILSLMCLVAGVVAGALSGDGIGRETAPLRDIPRGAVELNGRSLVELGILTLLATPLSYVFTSLYTFARQRDLVFVGVCVALIAVLAGSVGLALL